MKRSLSGSVLLVLLLALSFVGVVPSYLCLPAEAQSGQKTNATNSERKGTAKEFQFEVVSIRPTEVPNSSAGGRGPTPDGYRAAMSLDGMIKLAYSPNGLRIPPTADPTHFVNFPGWAGWYQMDARVAENDIGAWQAQGQDQELLRSAIRALLKDRFRLVLHEQQREIPVYNLLVSRKGIQFKPSTPGAVLPLGFKFPDGGVSLLFSRDDPTQPARFYNATIADLILILENGLDRPIYDGTGLTGRYDFSVYRLQDADPSERYLINKLGLELKPGKGTGVDLIIDHVEKPSPN